MNVFLSDNEMVDSSAVEHMRLEKDGAEAVLTIRLACGHVLKYKDHEAILAYQEITEVIRADVEAYKTNVKIINKTWNDMNSSEGPNFPGGPSFPDGPDFPDDSGFTEF